MRKEFKIVKKLAEELEKKLFEKEKEIDKLVEQKKIILEQSWTMKGLIWNEVFEKIDSLFKSGKITKEEAEILRNFIELKSLIRKEKEISKEEKKKKKKKICPFCGKPYTYRLVIKCSHGKPYACEHDEEVSSDALYLRNPLYAKMKKRKEILRRHRMGKLPKSYYQIDKRTGKPAILPHSLPKELGGYKGV